MAMAARIVQADLPGGQTAISIELTYESGVNGDDVGSHIAHEPLGVGRATLDQMWHMAIGAADFIFHMGRIILELCFLPMAIRAQNVRYLLIGKLSLDHTRMGVMAGEAIQNLMLALAEVAVLVGVLDKAILHIEGGCRHVLVTVTA
jgi:hypothetical protein